MKTFIFCVQLILISSISSAQIFDNVEDREYKVSHSLGLAAGATTGVGFSYEMGIKNYRLQITGIPVFNNSREFYSFGIANKLILKTLDTETQLFGYVAAHYLGTSNSSYYNCYYDSNGNYICPNQKAYNENLNVGIGGGLNMGLLPSVDFQLMAGYGLYSRNYLLTSGTITGEVAAFIRLR